MFSTPPAPVVVEWIVVHVLWSGEICTWYAVAQDLSQLSCTRCTLNVPPRSMYTHVGSMLELLDQRVAVFPSSTFFTGQQPADVDAVAGLFSDSSESAAGRAAAFAIAPPTTTSPITAAPATSAV